MIKVGILGATGAVGQQFVHLLENHPWFEVAWLGASEQSAGKTYGDVMKERWVVTDSVPEYVRDMEVHRCGEEIPVDVLFSALPSSIAGPMETMYAEQGKKVFSNASSHRMDHKVPMGIAEVSYDHFDMVKNQGTPGFIITKPNCSTTHMVLALKPLHEAFGIEKVSVVTMQALSGAGIVGEIPEKYQDNVVPYIGGEEEKMVEETRKLLGNVENGEFVNADIDVSASCNRVAVTDGHLEAVSVSFRNKPSVEDVKKVLQEFNPLEEDLPSKPKHPIVVMEEENRPQTKLDRMVEHGMASVVGRIREDNVFDIKFIVLGHNTIRGAAGGSILSAELMKTKGLL